MVVFTQEAADWIIGMGNVPGKDIEVVEAQASATVYHFHFDLAEPSPPHTVWLVIRLRGKLELVTLVCPNARYPHCLEI